MNGHTSVNKFTDAKEWCDDTNNYRLVRLSELTNSSFSEIGWQGEYPSKFIHRIVGGPIFAEWGIYTYPSPPYQSTWTLDVPAEDPSKRYVYLSGAKIEKSVSTNYFSVLCISKD